MSRREWSARYLESLVFALQAHYPQLGRILFCRIPSPTSDTITPSSFVPTTRPPTIDAFVLLINAASKSPWTELTSAVGALGREGFQADGLDS